MTAPLDQIWVVLSATPRFGLTLTRLAHQAADCLDPRIGMNPPANPVAMAIAIPVLVLLITGTPCKIYFGGARFVHFLLGPATVALAIPLHAQISRLRSTSVPALIALVAGTLTAALSAMTVAWRRGATRTTMMSLAPKSVTTRIAMGMAEKVGGLPALTAVLVISTVINGAVMARPLFDAIRIDDQAVRGFAVGVASHGIGTASAFRISKVAGAFAAPAMGLNGVAAALLFPVIASWIGVR